MGAMSPCNVKKKKTKRNKYFILLITAQTLKLKIFVLQILTKKSFIFSTSFFLNEYVPEKIKSIDRFLPKYIGDLFSFVEFFS